MNQKGISSIAIILIIVSVLAVGGGIWYWQKQIIKENVTILSPTEGEVWKNGETRTIKWQSVKGAEKVSIYLQEVWQEQNPVKTTIVENLGSLGQYDWKVSAKPIITEGTYQIIVQSADGYYRGISDAFKIIGEDETGQVINGTEKASGIIKSVYSKSGKNYIDIDYIELNPNWAPGGMSGSAYQNNNPKIRTFEISLNAKFIVGSPATDSVTFSEFQKFFTASNTSYQRYNPWDIVIIDGIVTEVKEHFFS